MGNNFSLYGRDFEIRLLASLMDDDAFISQVSDILKPEYFMNSSHSWLIGKLLDYYTEYKKAPSFLVAKTETINSNKDDNFKREAALFVADAENVSKSADLSYVKDRVLEFCKNHSLRLAIKESIPLIESNDFDSVKSLIDKAYKVGMSNDIGHIYKDSFELRYSEDSRIAIPTPWEPVNSISQGGLSEGELGIIVAPSGAGKSWVLASLGAHAARQGKTVVHYTLELNKIYTSKRYDSILSGIENANLLNNKDKVKDIVDNLKGNIVVEDYPSKGASVNTLRGHLDRCIARGIKPDVIIVDYADLLKGHHRDLRGELNQIYLGLRELASEFGCPVWTASQSNRSSIDEEVIQANRIAEDYSKIFTGDFIISLSRTTDNKVAGIANMHIIKNRFGPDGMTYPCRFNASIGDIEVLNSPTVDSTIESSFDFSSVDLSNL